MSFMGGHQALLMGRLYDTYANDVISTINFNDAESTLIPAQTLGSATLANDNTPGTCRVTNAAARFGTRGFRATLGSPSAGLAIAKNTTSGVRPFTVEFSFRPITFGVYSRFFGGKNTETGNLFYLSCQSNKIQFVIGGTERFNGGVITGGQWHSICVQSTGPTVTLDLNGSRLFTTSTYLFHVNGAGAGFELNGSGGYGGADLEADYDTFRWTDNIARYPSAAVDITGDFPGA